jgi:hypothetical protein
LGYELTVAGSALADLQVSGSLELKLVPAIQPGDVFAICRRSAATNEAAS